MKKIIQRIALVAMSIICACSFVACNGSGSSGNNSTSGGGSGGSGDSEILVPEDPISPITPTVNKYNLDTIHDIKVTPGTKDFVANGRSDYKIVLPSTLPDEETTLAADEIVTFILQSTGVELEVVSESAALTSGYNANSKYIVIGDTNITTKAGITVDKNKLTRSGYRIVSKDNSVFLIGGGDFGTLYAAYEFLYHEVGFECYAADEISLIKTNNLKLHEFDVTDVPDFTYRMTNTGEQRYNSTFARRLRLNQEATGGKIWMGPNNVQWHNTFEYLDPDVYKADNSDWYSNDGLQLCFYAKGNPVSYEKFYNTFLENFIAVIEANPDVDNITITQQDVNVWCNCDSCTADLNKYGTNAATVVKFCNKISDSLADYFEEQGSDRKVNICFFAYHKTTEAPVKKDENGSYVAIDDDVKCRDNVFCFYAPIMADYLRPLTDSENRIYAENMDKWQAITDHMYLWVYSTHFRAYFEPMDTTNAMQENYQFAKAHGVNYLFDQSQSNNQASTDWIRLKTYLNAKLAWDVQADMNALIDDFCKNYYKNAADAMKKAFTDYRLWFEFMKEEQNIAGGCFDEIITAETLPFGMVNSFLSVFDEAYRAIEPLKNSNPDTYSMLYDRVCMETLVYRYYQVELYSSYYSETQLLTMKKSFKEDVTRLGITRLQETADISELWTRWGLV